MIADNVSHFSSLRAARKLAKRLLINCNGTSDAELGGAFRSYQQLLLAGDETAIEASRELTRWHQSPHGGPYFLELLQSQAHREERKKSGAYYTPWPVAESIVRRVAQLVPAGPLRIVDPACGGGIFLLAAADLAACRPGSKLIGYDTSAAAVAAAEEVLRSAAVPAIVRRVNPLLAGEELQTELLSDAGTLVILGNPPYANFGRRNRGSWIDGLMADYRIGLDERKLNLTDDFIKFLRWGQHWIDLGDRGVLAMITSRTYLAGLTHRSMRRSLAQSFPHIEIVDLHGDGEPGDNNIFGVRRGVAIGVFSKRASGGRGGIQYHSVSGSRNKKLTSLQQSPPKGCRVVARPPDWMFVPGARRAKEEVSCYRSWPRLDEIFTEFISGVQTKNDRLFVDFDRDVLAARIKRHLHSVGQRFEPEHLRPYVVGPFDRRWIYYDPRLLGRARWQVMRHMVQAEPNIALVFMRQSTTSNNYDHALVVDALASDRVFYSRRGAPFVAPLWQTSDIGKERSPNLTRKWTVGMQERIGAIMDPQSLFAYVYAVLHSPSYRNMHLSHLQRDFPRIPMPESTAAFHGIAGIGNRLIACHLETDTRRSPPLECLGSQDCTVARRFPQLDGNILKLDRDAGLRLPDAASAGFHLGGHPVLHRWLKARRGRLLSCRDLHYFAWLYDVAVTTRKLAGEVDEILNPATPRSRQGATAAP